jgi:hypothetical protein
MQPALRVSVLRQLGEMAIDDLCEPLLVQGKLVGETCIQVDLSGPSISSNPRAKASGIDGRKSKGANFVTISRL